MMLEQLFAQAAQGEVFLRMVLAGAVLGMTLQLCQALRRLKAWLGAAGEATAVLLCFLLTLHTLLECGSTLRLYALLGLVLGTVLYQAGLGRMLHSAGVFLQKKFSRSRNARGT